MRQYTATFGCVGVSMRSFGGIILTGPMTFLSKYTLHENDFSEQEGIGRAVDLVPEAP